MRATLLATLFAFSLLGGSVGTAQAQKSAQTPQSVKQPIQASQNTAPAEPTVVEPEPLYRTLWLEAGLGYRLGPDEDGLLLYPRVGLRGIQPLTDTAALYAAVAYDGNVTVDVGGWYSFLPGAEDLFGFRSYAGTGLSYVAGSFGIALSAALSYELSTQTALVIVYTHRPLFFPELTQAFDLSLGVSFTLPQ